ncbi:LysR family transcriptional regulator [Kaustia mangrovi]|uniref:LysR family transcriptional regulator n=1 Tax=Kaustia mangrovi TaxID=2593653 RepID=A0A7S8C6Y3_9HYPH|nr:LysR family transcriptional regulator [Kaustia mangrovi]QPC44543.1 LysR family transcriptional regulator [Kaustia mangrovi]
MDVGELRVFEAVARLGSMNRAAQELHTVQSNVTARIRSLEDELGVGLFVRHARGVSITPAGQRLLPFAGRLAKLLADARSATRDDGRPGGVLLLGSLETTAGLRLSPVLTDFARTYPEVRLVLKTGTTRSLLDDVVECRLDAALVAGPVAHPELHCDPVFEEDLVLATCRTIRTLDDLRAVEDLRTIVFQAGCSYRQRLEAFLAELGLVTAEPLEFGSLEAITSCVAAGIGVTLLPKGLVAKAWQDGLIAVHELPDGMARAETLFVRREDAYLTSAATAFLDMIRSPQAGPL